MDYNRREWQLFEITMLDEVDRICRKYDLRYFLSSGTLLGAVRHKGFIPWDDDIDVDMPIEDYKKFCKIAQQEFGDKFFLQTYKTDKEFHSMWAMVRANGTTSMPVKSMNWNIHWGAHIDIFPIIGVYEKDYLRKLQNKLFNINVTLLQKHYYLSGALGEYTPNNKVKLLYKLPTGLLHLICDVNNKIIFASPKKHKIANCIWFKLEDKGKSECYSDTDFVLFEGKQYFAPRGYDEILTVMYGDYMTPPPENKRGGHEATHGEIIRDLSKDYREYKKELLKQKKGENNGRKKEKSI